MISVTRVLENKRALVMVVYGPSGVDDMYAFGSERFAYKR